MGSDRASGGTEVAKEMSRIRRHPRFYFELALVAFLLTFWVWALSDEGDQKTKAVTPKAKVATPKAKVERSSNGQAECRKLAHMPASVIEVEHDAVREDGNASGDTAIKLDGGVCWIKWKCEGRKVRACWANKTKFYAKA